MHHTKHFCAALTLAALSILSFGSNSRVFAQGITIGKLHLNDPHIRFVVPLYGITNGDTGEFLAEIKFSKTGMKTFSASYDTGRLWIDAFDGISTYRLIADYDSIRSIFASLEILESSSSIDQEAFISFTMRDVPVVFQDTALIVPPMSLDSMRARLQPTDIMYHYRHSSWGQGGRRESFQQDADSVTGSMQLMLGETFMAKVKPQKIDQAAALLIFPNPASNQIQITSSDKLSSIAIRDVTGRLLFDDHSALTSSHSIDTHAFPNGTYFVTGRAGSRDVVAKFVVNRW